METARAILIIVLAAGSGVLVVYWVIALARIARTVTTIPTARSGLALPARPGAPPSVCVVIPAHNEERIISGLVRSLRAQDYANLRVVLALDRCTDGTLGAARGAIDGDPRFHLLEITECPPDWAGKVNALRRAAESPQAAEADLLLFADADTVFDPACVRATVAMLEHRALDLLSLMSTLTSSRWHEVLAQPAAGFELMRQYPLISANRDDDRRAFANGQFMLFRGAAYRAIGGHAAVRDEILEDVALARVAAQHRLRTGVFLADRLLTCRMYPDWSSFRRGWQRIYTETANCKPARLAESAWRVRLVGGVLPLFPALLLGAALTLESSDPGRVPLAAFAALAAVPWTVGLVWVYRLSRAPLWSFPGHVVGSWLVASILTRAARDLRRGTPMRWGGREYVRPAR